MDTIVRATQTQARTSRPNDSGLTYSATRIAASAVSGPDAVLVPRDGHRPAACSSEGTCNGRSSSDRGRVRGFKAEYSRSAPLNQL